jgi:hypothetical protein
MMHSLARQDERLISRYEMQALLSFDQISLREDLAKRGLRAKGLARRLAGSAQRLLSLLGLRRHAARGAR